MYPNQPLAYPNQNPRSLKKLLIVVASLLVAALFAFGLVSKLTPDKNQTYAENFIKNVQAGKVDESYAMTSQIFKDRTSKQQWKDSVGRIRTFIAGDLELAGSSDSKIYDFRPSGKNYIITVNIAESDKGLLVDYFASRKLTEK